MTPIIADQVYSDLRRQPDGKDTAMLQDRTAERLAYIQGMTRNAQGPTATPEQMKPWAEAKPTHRALGPNALEWCRKHIPGFASHERQVLESEAHRQELRSKAGLA